MLLLLLCVLAGSDALTLMPTDFIKLNDTGTNQTTGNPTFGNEAATASAYDPDVRFLYVIGTGGDVMNVISLNDHDNPRFIKKVGYTGGSDGYPDAIAFCSSESRRYLAVSFETLGTTAPAWLKIYRPLANETDSLENIYNNVLLDGYDPTSMAWSADCLQLLVVMQGRVHQIGSAFDDPNPVIEVVSFGQTTPSRTTADINNAALEAAGVRHVFRTDCDGTTIDRKKDLEPRAVVMDHNNSAAYITFPKNNALARLDMTVIPYELEYINAQSKNWKSFRLDTTDDNAIGLRNFPISTFFQPVDIALFEHNGGMYIASADGGELMSFDVAGCAFQEGVNGLQWINEELFSAEVSDADKAILEAAMRDPNQLGEMMFTNIRDPSDFFDPTTQGFDQVTGFGARGLSILKVSTSERVYDSGERFENVYEADDFPEKFEATFNADFSFGNSTPSSRLDKTSLTTGPTPRAVALGEIGSTLVLVVANGYVGGLYYYTVDRSGAEPMPVYKGFYRRGNSGQTWETSYGQDGDNVGEPEIKHIEWIDLDSDTEAMIAVLSNKAGAVSFYKLTLDADDQRN